MVINVEREKNKVLQNMQKYLQRDIFSINLLLCSMSSKFVLKFPHHEKSKENIIKAEKACMLTLLTFECTHVSSIQQCPAMKLTQLRSGIFTSVPPLIYPQMSVHVETFSPAIVVFLHACYSQSNNSAAVQDNTQHVWIVYIRGQVTGTVKHFVELQNHFHLFGFEGQSWSLIT